jgi:hypothetical protein
MSLEIREIVGAKDLKTFIYLPEKINAGRPNWVPPVYMDDKKYFNPKKNKAFTYCDVIMLLALRDGKPVGRIMGIINRRFNEYRGTKIVRFGYIEAYENREVVNALVGRIEDWGRSKGMTQIIGPYGFSDQDPEGFMIEGFENRATIATYFNTEWMPGYVADLGYVKDVDYFVYKLEVPKEMPELYKKLYERIMRRGSFRILEFKTRKELKPWIVPIFTLMNECYINNNIYGYAPLDEKEMKDLAKRYLPVVDPRFVKIVLHGDEPAAFIIAMPDMTAGIQKCRGRLFPFGFIYVLRAAKKTKQLDLLLGAIKEKYRGYGLDALMGFRTFESAWEAGFEIMDTHHEMEANVRVRAEMERMGGKKYKLFRVFKKNL